MKNLLIGAISGNYQAKDLENWVKTSNWEDCERVLLYYNPSNNDILPYLKENNIGVIQPDFDFWGQEKSEYNFDTGKCDLSTSYDLIHNIRFYHIWNYLENSVYSKVLITDVKDVYFNRNPFDQISAEGITASSEEITYESEDWNRTHLHYNLGLIGMTKLLNKKVHNVGVFGGSYELVKQMCADIYLMSIGKHKVADQTSFNYLIQTKYKESTVFTELKDNFAVHLHVIKAKLVDFNLSRILDYSIVHQYDRFQNKIFDK
jgi:hypothetical protein